MKLRCRDTTLALDRTIVMGVLNVTPDSFSDGGLWLNPEAAVAHGLEMVAQGAEIIDVGGESTRPGAEPVSQEEELRRVMPVIEALAQEISIPISIDTRKPEAARRAVEAGASIVNDTAGEESADEIMAVAAESGVGFVIMHSRGTPATMRAMTQYDDVVRHTTAWLTRRADAAATAGVGTDSIVLDPGIGFAKTPDQNLELLARVDELIATGWPVLVGTSRKSFIGAVLGAPDDQRLEGTAASVAWLVARGVHCVRVHDVEAMTRVARMTEAIRGAVAASD